MQQDWIKVTGSATRARVVVQTLLAKYFRQLEANPLDYGIALNVAISPEECPELVQLTKEDHSAQLSMLQFNREQ